MTMANPAMASAATKAIRTPSLSPHTPMQSPPTIGPRAIGMRRTSECIDTPMVRLSLGSTLATRPMVAGSDMADQDRNSTAPTMTACQTGTRTTMRNPAIASRLKMRRARFAPSRSER